VKRKRKKVALSDALIESISVDREAIKVVGGMAVNVSRSVKVEIIGMRQTLKRFRFPLKGFSMSLDAQASQRL
jgi:hypothetical protein